jgi:G3E family GTPase
MSRERIPVCLVVGFLGSGKTTFLKQIIRKYAGKRLAFIINEWSSLDVDGAMIHREHDKVVCLAGGSVFCKCLSGQFIQTLKDLPRALHIPSCEGVVVEASGIADPGVAGKMLRESGLDALYYLSDIVAVVDPGNIAVLLEKLPNIKAQLTAADKIILNKVDVYSGEEVSTAERTVRSRNEHAALCRAVQCDADISLFGKKSQDGFSGNYALCADPNFCSVCAEVKDSIDLDRLQNALNAYQEGLFRGKGFVRGQEGPVYLDWTPSTVSRFELPDYEGKLGFVLIGAGDKLAVLRTIAARIESGAFGVPQDS